MKKLTVGILGAGAIGKVHARSITNFIPEVKIKYIVDPFPAAKNWVDALSGPIFSNDPTVVFNDKEVDAVLICSPVLTHVEYIKKAAAAKKHIFCEKPVDYDLSRIREAVKAVEDNKVKFQVGFNRRFDHNFKAAKDAITNGKIGTVRFVNITSRDPEAPTPESLKASGGLFMDMTIHDFDMARFLAGSEAVEVYAKGAVMVDPKIGEAGEYDSAAIVIEFANGAIAIINNCSEAAYGYDQRVEVLGSKGAVEIFNDAPANAIISTKDGIIGEKPLYFFMDRYTQSYVSEVKDFVDAVINNKPTPTNTIDGIKSVEIAIAVDKSARSGRPVRL